MNATSKSPIEVLAEVDVELLGGPLGRYATELLTIRAESGQSVPLVFNSAQRYLDKKLDEQRHHHGRVRALVLKARKQGVSTYVGGRFFRRIHVYDGIKAFLLSHRADSTDELFDISKRYYRGLDALYRPTNVRISAAELYFPLLDSGYSVATAGAKDVGRAFTIQLFHGCLGPDSFIIDQHGGLRRMADFRPGDMVRTHTGRPASIAAISSQQKPAKTVKFWAMQQMPLVATGEHRFLTDAGWRELGQLSPGDKVLFPIPQIVDRGVSWSFRLPDALRPQGGGTRETGPDRIAATYEVGRMLGLYLAEGTISQNRVTFAVHEREVDRTLIWLRALDGCFRSVKVWRRKNSKTCNVVAYGRSFTAFVEARCGKTDSKALPAEWAICGADFARGLVHGYLAGDGCSSKREYDRRISAPSIRSAIAVGMRDALAALGYGWAGIGYHPGRLRYGKRCQPLWTLKLCGSGVDQLCDELGWTMPPRRRQGRYSPVELKDGYAHVPIVAIEDAGEREVMDFEVDHQDHSYCTVHAATHNSEAAFWPNADDMFAGPVQAVPNEPGTEIILETTANGPAGEFYDRWIQARRGIGEYIAIFLPWYVDKRRQTPAPEDWEPVGEEIALSAQFSHLSRDQLYWYHTKNIELGGQPGEFSARMRQEWPSTETDAWTVDEGQALIPSHLVLAAQRAKLPEAQDWEPLILGVDIARGGGDMTRIISRRGRHAGEINLAMDTRDLMAIVYRLCEICGREQIDMVCIDATGLGAGVFDAMRETKWGEVCREINFGASPPDATKGNISHWVNMRSYMWDQMREWLASDAGASLPSGDTTFLTHLTAPRSAYDARSRLKLEPKEQIVKRVGFSPDAGDALALTFALPAPPRKSATHKRRERRRGSWMAA